MEGLQLEYPVFVDVEDFSLTSLGRAELTSLVQYAMDILYQRNGTRDGIATRTTSIVI